ncbi:MAG: potassium-transporting ATPase subunit KdpA [Proteobacteria bacterium]|nr:potassium-transporting ATPase subunit KdpA [Pseudomonadota bacterium]
MLATDILTLSAFIVVILITLPFLGSYMAKVFEGEKNILSPVVGGLENKFYRLCGINHDREMNYKEYLFALLMFNFLGAVLLFLILALQNHLPFNPQHLNGVPFWLNFNTTISFITNTNWQSYSGENTLSYFSQLAGLCVQNFLSAATGIAVIVAFAKGLRRKQTSEIGNFWVDLTRSLLYILLPLSVIMAILLMSQGVVQTFSNYVTAITLEGAKQLIPLGPAASQIAIKQLGSNGGGFFGVNSLHPFENPTPFSNFLEVVAILLIPAALTYTFGKLVGARRHGLVLFAAMATIFAVNLGISLWAEHHTNPSLYNLPFLEGKDTRFGITNSVLWTITTTSVSNGSVNAMISSMSPITGMIATINLILGEAIFGGVGAGLYMMLMFVILTVFIAGLMVGRTPEYLGKKIEAWEVKLAVIAVLLPASAILIGTMIACLSSLGLSSLTNHGPHGLMEMLYAFASASQNNGSAFAGLNANTNFYNFSLGICMLIGRYAVIIPALLIAGSLGGKKYTPPSAGTFATDNTVFVLLLIGVIIIIGGLTFFPALSLGAIAEHLLMINKSFLF